MFARVSSWPKALVVGVMSLTLASLLGGCNTSNTNLVEMNRALQDRNQALTAQNESLTNLNQQLQDALSARERALDEQNRLIAELRAGNADALAQFDELNKRFSGLRFGQMDPQTDAALQQLAAQHPDLLEYDSDRGLLRFKSDLTFASGSDVVSDAGRQTLNQLASILNSGNAAGYDLRILGHTDAQRISAGTARNHRTNMHLSAHRAISVRDVLVGSSVSAERFEVAGRGEFDPMVPNSGNGNTPANRRVEIYLDRPRVKRYSTSAPASAPAPVQPSRGGVEIMK